MSHSQDKFGTHLAQALSYLQRRHHHLKIWAALFIGEQSGGPGSGTPRPAPPEHPDPHPRPSSTAAGTWVPLASEERGE